MPSLETETPFSKQMLEMRPAWLQAACCACCRQHTPTQYQGVAMTTMQTGSAHGTPVSSSSASNGGASSSSSHCCCGLSLLVVVRLIFLVALLAAIIVGAFYFAELKQAFLDTLVYVRDLGPLRGSIVLCVGNIIGALLFMPCVPFTLGAGYLYGTLIGSLIVSIASTIAAVVAFLTARYLARAWIEKSLGGKGSKFRILDSAINQDGFRIVLLIRSSPLHPYGVCNYLFGLTSVTGRDYTVASFLGMLPGTIIEVYFGAAVKNVADIISGDLDNSMLSRVFFWVGLVVSIVVTVVVTVLLKRKLKSEMEKYGAVAMSESEAEAEADADEDEFGLLSEVDGEVSSNGANGHASEVTGHDSAMDDSMISDSEHHHDVSLTINHVPHMSDARPGSAVGSAPLGATPEASDVDADNCTLVTTGLKSTRRASKPNAKLSSFHSHPHASHPAHPGNITSPAAAKMLSASAPSSAPSSKGTTPRLPNKSSTPKPTSSKDPHRDAFAIGLVAPMSAPPHTADAHHNVHEEEEALESEALISMSLSNKDV